jgi:hypothetical protein
LSDLTFESFDPHVNSTFAVALGDATADLTLTEATKQAAHPYPGMTRDPFELLFRSAVQQVLPQRIYAFRHPAMGEFEMFIVPVGRDVDGVTYQAVFN